MSKRLIKWVLLLLPAVLGFLLVLEATPFGVGLVNDSIGYIGGARNILAGNGYSRTVGDWTTRPVTNYPPFYSLILAGISLTGLEAVTAARWLNAILFGVNASLVGVFTQRSSGSSLAGLGAALALVISEPFLRTHTVAMSEPVYLTLNFLVFACLIKYTADGWLWLVGAGLLCGLAYLTRYVGISITIVSILGILGIQKEWKGRLRDAGYFLLSGLPLPLIWILRNYLVSGNTGNRMVAFHPIPMDKWEEGVRNVAGWILPETFGLVDSLLPVWGGIIAVVGLIFLAAAAWMVWRSLRGQTNNVSAGEFPIFLFLLQAGIYPMLLIFTLTFIDASPIFEHRILTPFYISCIILASTGMVWIWRKTGRLGRMGLAIILLALAISLGRDTSNAMQELKRDGIGFSSTRWRESETIHAIRLIPQNMHIFSNKPTGIYILTGRPAYILPSPDNPAMDMPREGYQEGLAFMKNEVSMGRAVAVIFDYAELISDPDSSAWIKELALGIPAVWSYPDGVIFGKLPQN